MADSTSSTPNPSPQLPLSTAAPPPQPQPPTLKEALDAHRRRKLPGTPFTLTDELKQRLVKERDSLTGLDLRHADLTNFGEQLRGANLKGTDLTGADLTGTLLWDTTLRLAILTDVKGLLQDESGNAHPLSGADLAGAKLPEDIAGFPLLSNIAEVSKNAGLLFTALLGADAFMLLVIAKTKDTQIILNNSSATIPVINAEIPVSVLFAIGPCLLFVLYCTFHFYMQRLWELIVNLPAVFPEGLSMPQKTFPWLFNELGRHQFPRLLDRPQPLAWVQWLLFSVLAYLLIPMTLCIFWGRYLVRHDLVFRPGNIPITGIHIVLAGAFLAAMLIFAAASHVVLSRNRELLGGWRSRIWKWEPFFSRRPNPYRTGRLIVGEGTAHRRKAVTLLIIILLPVSWSGMVWRLSDRAINGYSKEVFEKVEETSDSTVLEQEWRDGTVRAEIPGSNSYRVVPYNLERLGLKPFARLEEAELSPRPDSWKGLYPEDYWKPPTPPTPSSPSSVKKGDTSPTKEEPVTDDITTVRHPADLHGQDLRFANLKRAFLVNADLRGTDLRHANLAGADLRGMKWDLHTQWKGANLSEVRLFEVTANHSPLSSDLSNIPWQNLYLSGIDLRGAYLRGVYLEGANLLGANLLGANLLGAIFDTSTIWPDGSDRRNSTFVKQHPEMFFSHE